MEMFKDCPYFDTQNIPNCPFCNTKSKLSNQGWYCPNKACYYNSWKAVFSTWKHNTILEIYARISIFILFRTHCTVNAKIMKFIGWAFLLTDEPNTKNIRAIINHGVYLKQHKTSH